MQKSSLLNFNATLSTFNFYFGLMKAILNVEHGGRRKVIRRFGFSTTGNKSEAIET